MVELGVNIDHVATLREARRTYEPDPAWAVALAVLGGADSITAHLREDRRHIQDRDVRVLRETAAIKFNLELSCSAEIVQVAIHTLPHQATLVPEQREEITTEGGLDLVNNYDLVSRAVGDLRDAGISVSLFLDPDPRQIEAAARLQVDAVELHTGQYALSGDQDREQQLRMLKEAGRLIRQAGLALHAGHGLNYHNVGPIALIPDMRELNIGHAVIARAVMVGMRQAVHDMKEAMRHAR